MFILVFLIPALVLGQSLSSIRQALLSRGYSQSEIDDMQARFTQLSAGLSPEARVAERQVIAIVMDQSVSSFEKRVRIMQFMSSQSPSVRAELQAVKQQLMPAGSFVTEDLVDDLWAESGSHFYVHASSRATKVTLVLTDRNNTLVSTNKSGIPSSHGMMLQRAK